MFIFKQSSDLHAYLQKERLAGKKCGFIPTMGALHEGHLSLVNQGRVENDLVLCSIFVNPTQFDDPKDFELYPKTVENDIYLLEKANCDVLFLPDNQQIYPLSDPQNDNYSLGRLEQVLEGKYRPGHFQGVCQVMRRLLEIVSPDRLYLGQKDFQQCMVIKRLIELLELKVEVSVCPTLREANGLAMSSRNLRLSEEEKGLAGGLFAALSFISKNLKPGCTKEMIGEATAILTRNKLKVEYLQISAAEDLDPVENWDGRTKLVALVAAYMGKVRLIDNMILPLNFAAYAN